MWVFGRISQNDRFNSLRAVKKKKKVCKELNCEAQMTFWGYQFISKISSIKYFPECLLGIKVLESISSFPQLVRLLLGSGHRLTWESPCSTEGRLEALANFSLYARNLAKRLYSISTLYSMYTSKGLTSWFEQCGNWNPKKFSSGPQS